MFLLTIHEPSDTRERFRECSRTNGRCSETTRAAPRITELTVQRWQGVTSLELPLRAHALVIALTL